MSQRLPKVFDFSDLKLLNRETKKSIYTSDASGSVNFALNAEIMEQKAGPSNYSVEAEVASFSSECTLNIGDYDHELLEAIGAFTNTTNSITNGLVTEITNQKGTLYNTTGSAITAIALSSTASDIRSGWYRAEITDVTNTQIKVYVISSPDLKRSEYEDYNARLLKTVTVATGSNDLGAGITATGASTVSFTGMAVGDTTSFRVFAPGEEAHTLEFGTPLEEVPHLSMMCLSRKIEGGRWAELYLENVILAGLNFNFTKEFSANEVTGRAIYDKTTGIVGKLYTYRKLNI